MNLLQETLWAIENTGHSPSDIRFIGSEESGHSCTWDEFVKLSDFEYDDASGLSEVASDIVIVFNDGILMWREKLNGYADWMHQPTFTIPSELKPISRLISSPEDRVYGTLAALNEK